MRLVKSLKNEGSDINIAAMVDVVFLLIIFFMTVSRLSRIEVERLDLPSVSISGAGVSQMQGPFVVNVGPGGKMVVEGETVSAERLGVIFRGDKDISGRRVVIRADKLTDWSYVERVMQVCAAEGISDVRVGVSDKTE